MNADKTTESEERRSPDRPVRTADLEIGAPNAPFNYSRLLCEADYGLFEEHKEVAALVAAHPTLFRYEHPHRKWEYGLCLKFIKALGRPGASVLEVGGGGSPLAPLLALAGYSVTVLDPHNESATLFRQEMALGVKLNFINNYLVPYANPKAGQVLDGSTESRPTSRPTLFDVVVATSVIEHVKDDLEFMECLALLARHGLFLTTDFHPTGQRCSSHAHERAYNARGMARLAEVAHGGLGWPLPDYDYRAEHALIYGEYTFASLAMSKGLTPQRRDEHREEEEVLCGLPASAV